MKKTFWRRGHIPSCLPGLAKCFHSLAIYALTMAAWKGQKMTCSLSAIKMPTLAITVPTSAGTTVLTTTKIFPPWDLHCTVHLRLCRGNKVLCTDSMDLSQIGHINFCPKIFTVQWQEVWWTMTSIQVICLLFAINYKLSAFLSEKTSVPSISPSKYVIGNIILANFDAHFFCVANDITQKQWLSQTLLLYARFSYFLKTRQIYMHNLGVPRDLF